MKITFLFSGVVTLVLTGLVAILHGEDLEERVSFLPVKVPKEELRLQRVLRLKEFRMEYKLASVPERMDLFLETYSNGEMVHRRNVTSAQAYKNKNYGAGTISVFWNPEKREIVVLNDNGFEYGPWQGRIKLLPHEMDKPFDAFYFKKSLPEYKQALKQSGKKSVPVYPVMGISGWRNQTTNYGGVSKSAEFIAACRNAGANLCAVLFYYPSESIDPMPLAFTEQQRSLD